MLKQCLCIYIQFWCNYITKCKENKIFVSKYIMIATDQNMFAMADFSFILMAI